MSTPKKIDALDFIRAISVIMIIVFHFMSSVLNRGGSWEDHWIVAPMGSIGVSFFIIISGAGIYLSSKDWKGVLPYYKKRFKSIYPTYWFVYLFMSCFLLIFANKVYIGSDPLMWFVTIAGFDGYMLRHMPTYYIIGEWFIGFIIIMYALFPFVRIVLNKSKLLALVLSIVFAIVIFYSNKYLSAKIPIFHVNAGWNPLVRLPEFIFGAIIADMLVNKSNSLKYIFIASFIYLTISISTFDNLNKGVYSIPSLCALFFIVTFIFTRVNFSEGFKLIVAFFSVNSFVAFLIHHQIIVVLGMYVKIDINSLPSVYLYMISIIFVVFTISAFLSIPIKYINKIVSK